MWNESTINYLKKLSIPKLYETEKIPVEEKLIYAHFFIGGYDCDWWIAEFDQEEYFFGFVCLNDPQNADWGYFLLSELRSIRLNNGLEIEFDAHWKIKRVSEIDKITFR